ncbi:hypothetical protein [Jidongwangia harbinensis]|uniref:hypothetical protein n=1 Tax=Jidongwangia harbinensis TaxID=2878561 RepID=UPI001CD94B25|nr:hypothetical protein [Jidongwangia harbinensis]MCA2218227.1 hypothetical protein [Jidongwangia harbinensis]
MGIGLSTEEMAADFLKAGIEPRWGSFWSGRLEEWLAVVLPPGAEERYSATGASGGEPGADRPGPHETVWEWTERRRQGAQTWSFPTNALRAEYLSTISARSEADVLALLRLFLFEESCFGLDGDHLDRVLDSSDVRKFLDDLPKEYSRRLMRWMSGTAKPHPSIRWVLDLLPHAPQQAIDAVMGYLNVYRSLRPSGRSDGCWMRPRSFARAGSTT